jgi:broad specificity phosphatase PhoE
MKRLILAGLLSVVCALPAQAQTVILVRHAEKADPAAGLDADPALSEAGQARARALAAALGDADLTHVVVSPLQRTRLTAAVAAEAAAVSPEAVSLDGGVEAHVARIAARIHALPEDAVVLVVGHSNTVPLIARALGQTDAADMQDCEYDRLTVLDLDGGETRGEVSRYGPPSACDPA